MTDPLPILEQAARQLEPDAARRDDLITQVIAYADRFLEGLASAPMTGLMADYCTCNRTGCCADCSTLCCFGL